MEPNIVITSVEINPNPVEVNKSYIISVQIKDRVPVFGDESGRLVDSDDAYLLIPDQVITCLADADGAVLADVDGSILEHI